MSLDYDVVPSKPKSLWPYLLLAGIVFLVCLVATYPPVSKPSASLGSDLPWTISQVKISGLALETPSLEARKLAAFRNNPNQHFAEVGNRVRMISGQQLSNPNGQLKVGESRDQLLKVMQFPAYPKNSGDRLLWRGANYALRVQLEHDRIHGFMLHEAKAP